MTCAHTLGFPRIGAKRELKFALESYWRGETDAAALEATGATLRRRHWQDQAGLDLVPVGDFSFYDQVLDMSVTLGHLPERARDYRGSERSTVRQRSLTDSRVLQPRDGRIREVASRTGSRQ